MAFLPSLRNLLIPNKTAPKAHKGYSTDMQQLEIWARQPIQELVAGSGVTISNGGVATDSKGNGPFPITISASGGSGGYASLTGPGETVTPGQLTQAGAFDINGLLFVSSTTNNNVISSTSGNTSITTTTGGFSVDANDGSGNHVHEGLASNAWGVTGTASGDPSITVNHTQVVSQATFGSPIKYITETLDGTSNPPTWTIVANLTHTIIEVAAPGVGQLGFFGVSPVSQQSSSGITTVAQLVTILQNYGLLS